MKLECACFEALPVYQVNNVLLNHSYFSKMLSVITLPIQFKTPKIRSYDMVPPRFTLHLDLHLHLDLESFFLFKKSSGHKRLVTVIK